MEYEFEKSLRGCGSVSINIPDELSPGRQSESLNECAALSNGFLELDV